MSTQPASARPSLWELFRIFLVLGVQSFGGGSSTLYLIHQAAMQGGWMGEEEFVRTYALVQISPGINLIKLTMLLGHRLRGWAGLIFATAGMLLPSAGVTVLMTAGFSAIRQQPLVQAAMKGVMPATIGLSLAMAVQMGQPLFSRAYREGPARLGSNLAILAAAALLMAVNGISPVMVLLGAGAAGLLLAVVPVKKPPLGQGEAAQ
jgi:chromate transporter